MNPDMQAAKVAQDYGRFVTFAASKASQKWAPYIRAKGSSAPFDHEDIEQLALEALLVLAGLMPGRKVSISGRLAEVEAISDAAIQRTIDLYVSSALQKLARRPRALKRGSDMTQETLESVEDAGLNGEDAVAVETATEALTGVSERFPLLYATEIEGLTRREVMEAHGLKGTAYDIRRRREVEVFSAWAYANRRVAA